MDSLPLVLQHQMKSDGWVIGLVVFACWRSFMLLMLLLPSDLQHGCNSPVI